MTSHYTHWDQFDLINNYIANCTCLYWTRYIQCKATSDHPKSIISICACVVFMCTYVLCLCMCWIHVLCSCTCCVHVYVVCLCMLYLCVLCSCVCVLFMFVEFLCCIHVLCSGAGMYILSIQNHSCHVSDAQTIILVCSTRFCLVLLVCFMLCCRLNFKDNKASNQI